MTTEVRVVARMGTSFMVEAEALVDGKRVCTAELMFGLREGNH